MRHRRSTRGFTLVEIMIVAALIALLSGIAVFSINTFYQSNVRKATIGELNRLYTALEFARQDLQFYPKFCYLNSSRDQVLFDQVTGLYDSASMISNLDYYGFVPGGPNPVQTRVNAFWNGPYFGMSAVRGRQNRGLQSGLTTVRLADVFLQTGSADYSKVRWPADPYGQPYVLYQMRGEISGADRWPVFVSNGGQEGDFLNAVVSYGPNGVPGGNGATPLSLTGFTGGPTLFSAAVSRETLREGALFVLGDPLVGDGEVGFTMKSALPSTPPEYRLETWYGSGANANHEPVLDSLVSIVGFGANPAWLKEGIDWGQIGMLEPGTDDLVIQF